MARWSKREIRLPQNHGWRAKPGNRVFVADRGKMMFEFPADWIMDPTRDPSKESMRFYDKPEPDDNIRLEISIINLNSAIDWTGLPITDLVENAVSDDTRGVDRRGPMRTASRADLGRGMGSDRFHGPGRESQGALASVLRARLERADVHYDGLLARAPQ